MESNHHRCAMGRFSRPLSTINFTWPLWWLVLNLRHTVQPIRSPDDRSRKGKIMPHFLTSKKVIASACESTTTLVNVIGCHAATQHLFVDWDMTPLRQCSTL
uniref:Uncharacterized protein n=1 Tax=Salmonella sp. TaxID=599 RepID=A0A482ETC4_SALSP|nr:hypothetical protein NNIBIDOC_00113 [Salmonella sp.]